MFKRVMVANRGEVALRILRTLREMEIESVLASSATDMNGPAALADQAICIGPGEPENSYLNSHQILSAALACEVEAIHPGYGFLSEDASFSKLCHEMGVKFIGPAPSVLEKLSDKAFACRLAEELEIPTLYLGVARNREQASEIADRAGFPVVLKPVVGGGGKGIRIVYNHDQLSFAWKQAHLEIPASFQNDGVYLERYIACARHIELQVARDAEGGVIAFPPRECSLQYKFQKWIEETPPPICSENTTLRLSADTARLAECCDLVGIATVEYLVCGDEHFFIEVNPRLQVEHAITEMVSGWDLVREQLRLAAGESLGRELNNIGHAIEARLYGFPCGGEGKLHLRLPGGPGIRVDAPAGEIQPSCFQYDSLLAKICASSTERELALARIKRALEETEVSGMQTNLQYLRTVVESEAFRRGEYDILSLQRILEE